jgi:MarR family transcriptional regulator, organic hydroperoxide resistance regulator
MTGLKLNYRLHDASIGRMKIVWRSGSGIIAMNFEEVRNFWADVLGVRGPQWMIIVAVQQLGRGEGVLVTAVATMLHVNPAFVLTQSRRLEKKGFIRRTAASDDSGIASLSLTDKACKHLAKLV